MEAVLAVALLFLPAIVFFVRSPYKPGNADVLGALLGVWLALTALIYIGNWLLPKTGSYWLAVAGWGVMLIYAWKASGAQRAEWEKRHAKRKRTDA